MRTTITTDQMNIGQLHKSYSERLISAMADYGVSGHLTNPSKEFGGNYLFQSDLLEDFKKD